MRAMILRRVGLIESGTGGAVLIGPRPRRHGPAAGFLTRNGHPHHLLDPAVEPEARRI